MAIPSMQLPSFRTCLAAEKNALHNILFQTDGGIGDTACSEPVIRFAKNHMPGCRFTLSSFFPELFRHLDFDEVIKNPAVVPNPEEFLTLRSLYHPSQLISEFLSHYMMQCVDYCSVAMWRAQLPVRDRCILLVPSRADVELVRGLCLPERAVAVHPGMSWPSRTFPIEWWNAVLRDLLWRDAIPILIGSHTNTVEVDARGCIDLRGHHNLMQSVAVLQSVRVFLTNDSGPLHLAASGPAWIGFISTSRHPDAVTHWRNGGSWGWRMRNFSRGGVWEIVDTAPNTQAAVEVAEVSPGAVERWLPETEELAQWASTMAN